jgi:hypothetical protein
MLLKLQDEYAKLEAKFREQEQNLVKLNADFRKEVKEIFDISGVKCDGEDFDWDGDDDLLKINFGGRNVDIKRSVLTKPPFGWNFFSCLFQKRWDGYHVRDKKGRIYVDLKESWLRPLINYLKYNEDSDSLISLSNYFLRQIVKIFEMDEILDVGESFELKGLESSALTTASHGETGLKILLDEFFDPQPLQFNKLYSSQVNPLTETPANLDVRFMPLLYVLQYKSGATIVIVSTVLQTPASEAMNKTVTMGIRVDKADQKVQPLRESPTQRDGKSNLRERFPLKFLCSKNEKTIRFDLDLNGKSSFSSTEARFMAERLRLVEVYEIREPNREIRTVPEEFNFVCDDDEDDGDDVLTETEEVLNDLDGKDVNAAEDEEEVENSGSTNNFSEGNEDALEIEKIIERVNLKMGKTAGYYKTKKLQCTERVRLFEDERKFLAGYFSQTWKKELPSENSSYREVLMNVIQCKSSDVDAVEAVLYPQEYFDPIVYFNVEGEVIPILRSTIQRVIPDSQLAVRVSGRWKEQERDRDEDGNLIVDCHKGAFEQILSALQINPLRENPLEVIVNMLSRNAIEQTLNYFMINPEVITFLE